MRPSLTHASSHRHAKSLAVRVGPYNIPMARLYPFRALRYDPTHVNLTDVVTQPYDKITPAMQDAYYAASPHNLIRVILGKHRPDDTEAGPNVYTRAASTLNDWRAEGILKIRELYLASPLACVAGCRAVIRRDGSKRL